MNEYKNETKKFEKDVDEYVTALTESNNDDFIINNKIIPSNNYQVKKKNGIQQKKVKTKTTIMSEKFGFNSAASYT